MEEWQTNPLPYPSSSLPTTGSWLLLGRWGGGHLEEQIYMGLVEVKLEPEGRVRVKLQGMKPLPHSQPPPCHAHRQGSGVPGKSPC